MVVAVEMLLGGARGRRCGGSKLYAAAPASDVVREDAGGVDEVGWDGWLTFALR